MQNTFAKEERLCQDKLIEQLFREGEKISVPSLRLRWLVVSMKNPYPAQVLLSVPKNIFPKASDRNLLKRRMKESYRKNKQILYESLDQSDHQMIIAFTYSTDRILPMNEIQEKIILLLQRLKHENEKAFR